MAVSEDSTPEELFAKLMSEDEPLIPPGFAEQIDRDVQGVLGITRRMALAYLSRTFREVVEKVAQDRDFAVSLAHVADVLKGHAQSYETLAGWLKVAHTRMALSIAIREDLHEIFAAAKAATAQAAREQLGKKFLTVVGREELP